MLNVAKLMPIEEQVRRVVEESGGDLLQLNETLEKIMGRAHAEEFKEWESRKTPHLKVLLLEVDGEMGLDYLKRDSLRTYPIYNEDREEIGSFIVRRFEDEYVTLFIKKYPLFSDKASRFVAVFSVTKSKVLRRFFKNEVLLKSANYLDAFWIPYRHLVGFLESGKAIGFTTKFKSYMDYNATKELLPGATVRVWSGNAKRVYKKLSNVYDYFLPLSSVHIVSGNTKKEEYANVALHYNGYLDVSGTSLEKAEKVVISVVDQYLGYLGELSNQYESIEFPRNVARYFKMRIPPVEDSKTKLDAKTLFNTILSRMAAFRLFGYHQVIEGRHTLIGLDLHHSDEVFLLQNDESDGLHVLLSLAPESCINTVPRILSNIQQKISPRAELTGEVL